MKKIIKLIAILSIILFLIYPFSQGENKPSPTPNKLRYGVLNSAGGISKDNQYKINFSFGPQFIGESFGGNLKLRMGYLWAITFPKGDVNVDEVIDIGDIVYLINYVFYTGSPPVPCVEKGDCNCDGIVDIGDIVCLINYVFYNGPPPCCG